MDSMYLIWFHSIEFGGANGEGIVSVAVDAPTFLAVEDYAHDNTPDGYELRSIEKHYGTPSELLALYGDPDVDLRSERSAS